MRRTGSATSQDNFPCGAPKAEGAPPGRWHDAGAEVIYACEHYSTAMLETLAHWNGALPPNQHFIEFTLSKGLSYEIVTADAVPDWFEQNSQAPRRFGQRWYDENRTAILIVPSVVARIERNIVINRRHPQAGELAVGLEIPVWWDRRLFA